MLAEDVKIAQKRHRHERVPALVRKGDIAALFARDVPILGVEVVGEPQLFVGAAHRAVHPFVVHRHRGKAGRGKHLFHRAVVQHRKGALGRTHEQDVLAAVVVAHRRRIAREGVVRDGVPCVALEDCGVIDRARRGLHHQPVVIAALIAPAVMEDAFDFRSVRKGGIGAAHIGQRGVESLRLREPQPARERAVFDAEIVDGGRIVPIHHALVNGGAHTFEPDAQGARGGRDPFHRVHLPSPRRRGLPL